MFLESDKLNILTSPFPNYVTVDKISNLSEGSVLFCKIIIPTHKVIVELNEKRHVKHLAQYLAHNGHATLLLPSAFLPWIGREGINFGKTGRGASISLLEQAN